MTSKIYLISPPEIEIKSFAKDLEELLKTGYVSVFQLRLKGYNQIDIEKIAQELQKICHDNNCLFILNDYIEIALQNNFDGVHLGQNDLAKNNFLDKSFKSVNSHNFIIGISCYDSLDLAFSAEKMGASYVSFGAFFPTKTKKVIANPQPKLISLFNSKSNLPVTVIGGINANNAMELVENGADFISVISYIWDNSSKVTALKMLHQNINSVFDNKYER